MKVWVIADGEAPPIEQKNPSRLFPLQLFSDAAAKAGHKVTYWCSTFHHHKKSFLFNEDKLVHYWDTTKLGFKIKLLNSYIPIIYGNNFFSISPKQISLPIC